MQLDTANLLTLFYVAVFPSTLAYLCFNRGVQLIGANRAAPFFHVVPVFGSAMAIVFLGERPQLFHIIGFALVLTGVFVASRKPAQCAAATQVDRRSPLSDHLQNTDYRRHARQNRKCERPATDG